MSLLLEHFAFSHADLHLNTEPPELPPPGIHSDVNAHALNAKRVPHNSSLNTHNDNISVVILKAKFVPPCMENSPPAYTFCLRTV